MKYTTAKNVIEVYLSEGRFEKKKCRAKREAKKAAAAAARIDEKFSPSALETAGCSSPIKDLLKSGPLTSLLGDFWAERMTAHLANGVH